MTVLLICSGVVRESLIGTSSNNNADGIGRGRLKEVSNEWYHVLVMFVVCWSTHLDHF
jgi:hypothetical protein